jgi:general stress protein YciG
MDVDKQREIARKGGQTVSQNRQHMAEIGRKGGQQRKGRGRRDSGIHTDLNQSGGVIGYDATQAVGQEEGTQNSKTETQSRVDNEEGKPPSSMGWGNESGSF